MENLKGLQTMDDSYRGEAKDPTNTRQLRNDHQQ